MAAMPEHVIQFNHLYVVNDVHRKYPHAHTIFQKPKHGLSELAQYLQTRVSDCLRDKVGRLAIGGKSHQCFSCERSRACDALEDCASLDGNSSEPINYMDVVKCK